MRRLLTSVLVIGVLAVALRFSVLTPVVSVAALHRINDGVLRAVVLGDSVAHGAGDEKGVGLAGWLRVELGARTTGPIEPLNLALNGARTFNLAARLREPGARQAITVADVIVISIGGNDLYGDPQSRLLSRVWPWYQRQSTLDRVEGIVRAVQGMNPTARIRLLGLYNPYRHTRLEQWVDTQVNLWDGDMILRFAAEPRVTVVRIEDLLRSDQRLSPIDHFHPGSDGYAAIARRIVETLQGI